MTGAELYIQRLLTSDPLREPVLRSAIQSLHLPPGSHGLDVGCGIGLQELLLADAVGPEGHITGIDLMPELLSYGRDLVRKAGFSKQISFQEGDAHRLPFAQQTFDWVWSADFIGYPAGDLPSMLDELSRVVKPGGSIIILGWTSQRVLPGYSILEDRLNAMCSSYIPFLKEKSPEQHFIRALHGLREAGLEDIKVQTFVGDVQAPLRQVDRTALVSLFEMLWEEPKPPSSSEDWNEYQRLCKPESSNFILNEPDYYAFFTYTMFRGRVP